jgi:hypothetical protein
MLRSGLVAAVRKLLPRSHNPFAASETPIQAIHRTSFSFVRSSVVWPPLHSSYGEIDTVHACMTSFTYSSLHHISPESLCCVVAGEWTRVAMSAAGSRPVRRFELCVCTVGDCAVLLSS